MKINKGFTMIELLIVIAVLGILAVAVLSAINPIEQMRKARDAGRKSDAAELLNALERYYTTFQCYSWDTAACNGSVVLSAPVNPVFTTGGNVADLVTKSEMKTQFQTRSTVTKNELWLSETTAHTVSVCFEPESTTARNGGLGPLMTDKTNTTKLVPQVCSGTYPSTTCYVCVPQ